MKRFSLIIAFAILGAALAVFPPIPEFPEVVAHTEDDGEALPTTQAPDQLMMQHPIESDDFTTESEPVDVGETRQSRSPLVSVYLRKTKLKPQVTANNATAANFTVGTEEIEIAPTAEIAPATKKIRLLGSRDEVPQTNYTLVMPPGPYYGPMYPGMEILSPEEEDNRFFNVWAMLHPRKPYVPGTARPYSSPRPNYANFLGPQAYGYQSGYGQSGYGQYGYGSQSAYGPPPDEGYRLGGGTPGGLIENPEEEENKFFALNAEILSPPKRPYVPGSIQPNAPGSFQPYVPGSMQPYVPGGMQPYVPGSMQPYVPGSIQPNFGARPNYAGFMGPRPSYGYEYGPGDYGIQQSPYPYYGGYNENF